MDIQDILGTGNLSVNEPCNIRPIQCHFQRITSVKLNCIPSGRLAKMFIKDRLRAIGKISHPPLHRHNMGNQDPSAALMESRKVVFVEGTRATLLYRAELLQPGNRIEGPAVVVRSDTTILVCPGDLATVDAYGNLIIEVAS